MTTPKSPHTPALPTKPSVPDMAMLIKRLAAALPSGHDLRESALQFIQHYGLLGSPMRDVETETEQERVQRVCGDIRESVTTVAQPAEPPARRVHAFDEHEVEPPAQAATDDLVQRLRVRSINVWDAPFALRDEAADALQRLRAENTKLTAEARTANERHHVETERRVRAEAERDTLAAIVRAADAYINDEPSGKHWDAYRAARAKVNLK